MNRKMLAAACLAAAVALGPAPGADAGEADPRFHDWIWRNGTDPGPEAILDDVVAVDAGAWTFAPVAGLRSSRGDLHGHAPSSVEGTGETVTASLGFRGSARVDSRIGTIYSRLSLSFEHEFRANDHQVITGLSGAGPNGFYGDRSEIDVLAADAAFAMRMSETVFGYLEYGSAFEPGGPVDHQVILRLRFDF